jgi:hypothetical protein
LRSGNWKLVNGAELYDLSVDKYEKADLAARYPARVAELKARLERAEARVKEGEW